MELETEVKICLEHWELKPLRDRLRELGATLKAPRTFESNLLFDFPDRRLTRSDCALRLRTYGDRSLITFKGRVEEGSRYKERPEAQTAVEDSDTAKRILEAVGFEVCFRYEKHREKWVLRVADESVEVCVDETPIGDFSELEGSGPAIEAAAEVLGWDSSRFLRANYVDLYLEAGLGPTNSI
jgi:adenylate cyclase class 2